MKKGLIVAAIIVMAAGTVLTVLGAGLGWFGSKPQPAVGTTEGAAPQELPDLVEWIDTRVGSGDRKQEAAGHAELGKPETFKRLVAAVDDEKTPLPLRKRTLLLVARDQNRAKDLLPLARKHAGDPASPLRPQAVVVLAGMRDIEKLDEGGYVTVTLATASKDSDEQLRLSATHGLVRLKSKAAVQAMVERLSDPSAAVRKLAASHLKELSGQDFDYSYSRAPKGQTEAIARWQAWAGQYEPKP